MSSIVIYDVECQLDPDIVADYDAWLPGHVRDVLACAGFLGASIDSTETPPGERQRRRIRTGSRAPPHSTTTSRTRPRGCGPRLPSVSAAACSANGACTGRAQEILPARLEPPRCLNCGAPVTGSYCANPAASPATCMLLSMREVAGDFTHSLLHLDGRVWQTIQAACAEARRADARIHRRPPPELPAAVPALSRHQHPVLRAFGAAARRRLWSNSTRMSTSRRHHGAGAGIARGHQCGALRKPVWTLRRSLAASGRKANLTATST